MTKAKKEMKCRDCGVTTSDGYLSWRSRWHREKKRIFRCRDCHERYVFKETMEAGDEHFDSTVNTNERAYMRKNPFARRDSRKRDGYA